MKKYRHIFVSIIAVFLVVSMAQSVASALDGSEQKDDYPTNGRLTTDDKFGELVKEQGGIVVEEKEYIEINGERVGPDDPFLQWIKEQEWEVVENHTDNDNEKVFSGALANNQLKRQEWIDKFYSKDPSAFLIVSEYDAFKKLSDKIVAGISGDYQKVYAIHDWVCSNIYYDFPAYTGGTTYRFDDGSVSWQGNQVSISADEFWEYSHMSKFDRLMTYKRGLCASYADTFEDLVRAQGIPCITVTGIANGMGGPAPHAWNEVYVNDKWINVDTTFDSNCRYMEEGKYFDGPVAHRYFDATDESFALDHKASEYPAGARGHRILKDILAYGELGKGGDIESSLYELEGSDVTLIVRPDAGYQLSALQISDNYGKKLDLKPANESNNQFYFTMPASDVWVKAEFALESDSNANPIVKTTTPFQDIGESDYFFEPVKWAIEQGITGGTSSKTFSPNQTCTKAEIITFIWRAAGSPEPEIANPFTDVSAKNYFYKPALWAFENNLVEGSGFAPHTPCTRAMAVEFLWQQAGCPKVATRVNFSDVEARADYVLALGWALENSVTGGTSSTTFSPNQTCTRAQIVTFLYRDRTD